VGGMEQQIAHQVLNVTNATAEDEGYYECQTIDHTQKFESTSVFIKIHGKFLRSEFLTHVSKSLFI